MRVYDIRLRQVFFSVGMVFVSLLEAGYSGERCVDAALLSGVRSLQDRSAQILGKVCSIQDLSVFILKKVCDIQVTTTEILEKVCDIQVTTTEILEKVCDIQVTTTETLEKVCDLHDCAPAPISQPVTITESGSYCVTQNLTGDGTNPVITIAANSVCLDLNCRILDGLAVPAIQVTDQNKIVIDNGCVTGTATIISLDNVNGAVIREMQFQGGDTSLSVENSNLVRIEHCDISGSSGQRGIFCSESIGVNIDGVLISNNDLTLSGIEFFNSQCIAVKNSEICDNGNGVRPQLFFGILGNNCSGVAIENCTVSNCSASSAISGITESSVGSLNWLIRQCLVSGLNSLSTSPPTTVRGILAPPESVVCECVVENLLRDDPSNTGLVVGYAGTGNVEFLNNIALSLRDEGGGPFVLSTGFNLVDAGTCAIGNISKGHTRVNGFSTSVSNGVALFDNVADTPTTAGAAYLSLGGSPLPTIRLWNPATGAFTTPPEPFDNIEIL